MPSDIECPTCKSPNVVTNMNGTAFCHRCRSCFTITIDWGYDGVDEYPIALREDIVTIQDILNSRAERKRKS